MRRVPKRKPLVWIASSHKDLCAFPAAVRQGFGHALDVAQCGETHNSAKALKGFGHAGVLEIIEDFSGDTYRAVYTVKFAGRIYVLHAFQKKSKSGIATRKADIELIKSRLKRAEKEHQEWLQAQKSGSRTGVRVKNE